MTQKSSAVLDVKNLTTVFYTEQGIVPAVHDLSFSLQGGKTLGIVGESGCGKSVTALSIMRLIQGPMGEIVSGEIEFEGKNLLALSAEQMSEVRGSEISMIFQEPMTSLNPVLTIGEQLSEVFIRHQKIVKSQAWESSIELLRQVGIGSPKERVNEYPHSLSGGMRQRVMIAMALACRPKILICDEPTTALDVTVQAQILDLMKALQTELNMAMIFISHNLGVVSELCDEVIIMYAGKAVEWQSTHSLFTCPRHPYTEALLKSIPRLGVHVGDLDSIPGSVPDLLKLPMGCHFADRCQYVQAKCRQVVPDFFEWDHQSYARCFFPVHKKRVQ